MIFVLFVVKIYTINYSEMKMFVLHQECVMEIKQTGNYVGLNGLIIT